MPRKTCFYELLGISFQATSEEVKKAFRRQALLYHPDRCRDLSAEEAKQRFQALNEAYETLSNPQERAWYDGHRNEILGGSAEATQEGGQGSVNVWPFFSRSCFEAFDDGAQGFFTVYCHLFERVDAEDIQWSSRTTARPSFGTASSDWSAVSDFYSSWEAFTSMAAFGHAALWRLSDAPNRDVRRVMEQENKKAIGKARREYSETVRRLVDWLRRRDPRVLEQQRQRVAKAQEAALQAEKERELREEELARGRAIARERELQRFEERRAEKEILKAAGQVFLDSSDETESEEEKADQRLVCPPCRKTFKSAAQMAEHFKSKKHIQTCRKRNVSPMMNEVSPSNTKDKPSSKDDDADAGDSSGSETDQVSPVEASEPKEAESAEAPVDQQEESNAEEEEVVSSGSEEEVEDEGSSVDVDDFVAIGAAKTRKKTCPVESSEAEDEVIDLQREKPESVAKEDPDQKNRRRRRAKAAAASTGTIWKCLMCSATFPTRNQLMQHVKKEGHAALKTEALKQAGGKKRR